LGAVDQSIAVVVQPITDLQCRVGGYAAKFAAIGGIAVEVIPIGQTAPHSTDPVGAETPGLGKGAALITGPTVVRLGGGLYEIVDGAIAVVVEAVADLLGGIVRDGQADRSQVICPTPDHAVTAALTDADPARLGEPGEDLVGQAIAVVVVSIAEFIYRGGGSAADHLAYLADLDTLIADAPLPCSARSWIGEGLLVYHPIAVVVGGVAKLGGGVSDSAAGQGAEGASIDACVTGAR